MIKHGQNAQDLHFDYFLTQNSESLDELTVLSRTFNPKFLALPLPPDSPLRRPFLISVDKGAAIIADLTEKKVKSTTVPVYPWNIIGRMMKILPAGVIAKI